MVISWNTHKTATGFRFDVYSIGYQVPMVVLQTGELPTRARAVAKAKEWCRYLKTQAA